VVRPSIKHGCMDEHTPYFLDKLEGNAEREQKVRGRLKRIRVKKHVAGEREGHCVNSVALSRAEGA